jgi:Superfamily I DNA and RNA helicases
MQNQDNQQRALTIEQNEALANTDFAKRFGRRQSVYRAYAGGGKTFIIIKTAEQLDDEALIVAFNAAIIQDIQPRIKKFGNRVKAMTSHKLARESLPEDYRRWVKTSLDEHNGDLAVPQIVEALNLQIFNGWPALQVASLVKRTVSRFCQTSDTALTASHIPNARAFSSEAVDMIMHESQRLWSAFESLSVPITHDVYFKIWALSKPQFSVPYRLIDEGQDTNPALSGVLFDQKDGLNVWAGDPYQSIYAWRGAKNALAEASERSDSVTSYLTQSFRFGEETAEMATRLLKLVGETRAVKGTGSTKIQGVSKDITPDDVAHHVSTPFAWIAFTNAALIQAAIVCVGAHIPFHIVGQGSQKQMLSLLYSAMALKRGEIKPAGPLGVYQYWSDLEDEAAINPGGEAARLVRLQQYPGFYDAAEALRKSTPTEASAKVILSTVHAAKGREWDLVVLDKDLDATRTEGDRRLYVGASGDLIFDDCEDIHMRYVAITRARKRLVMACPHLYYWLTH